MRVPALALGGLLMILIGCAVRNCVCKHSDEAKDYKCLCVEHGVHKTAPCPAQDEKR